MTDSPVTQRIRQTIENSDVVLFMKGTPVFPQCGFSATLVQVLSLMGVKFKGVDVLADDGIRNGSRIRKCAMVSRPSAIGQPSRSSTLKANLSAAAISSVKCMKMANWLSS